MRALCTLGLFLGFFAGAVHGHSAPVLLFPGVTHAAVILNNRTVTSQSILLELLPRGSAIASVTRSVVLGPGESQEIADLHAFLGAAGGDGMLRVTGSVTATVLDQSDESVQKELPAVDPGQAIAPNEGIDFPYTTPTDLERDARSNLILVNLEARDVTVTLSQGSMTARKTIPAGAFVQIDNLGAFLGTPAGIQSAHAIADGRWFGAIITLSTSASGLRRRAVGPPTTLLSSAGLIDKALAAGTINAEQALTYKVFADFGDQRLPAAFRGDDKDVITVDSPALAAQQWASLSPATRDLIGPYLVPAFYEGSWWDLRRPRATSIRPLLGCKPWEDPVCPMLTDDWAFVAGKHVRVWYEKARVVEDGPTAVGLRDEVDAKIWDRLFTVMGRYPILYHEIDGTKLLDVGITDNINPKAIATTFPLKFGAVSPEEAACMRGPTYVVVHRDYVISDRFLSAFAHELFHSVQHSFKPTGCYESRYKWLMESTATWFEDELYPKTNREHDFAKKYLDKTELSLGTDIGLAGDERTFHWYGAYTFFFFLTRIDHADPNTLVRNVWEGTESEADALHALKAGLAKSGKPLETSWPDFAANSWNDEAPFNLYQTILSDGAPEKLTHKAKIQSTENMSVSGGDKQISLGDKQTSLPHLSMRYFRIDFPDATASTVAFYNGLQRALNPTPVTWIENFGNVLTAKAVSNPASIKGAHVDALVKIDGKWTRADDNTEVWNDKPYKTFCRDIKKERIESMVIILSNSDIENTLQPPGIFAPIVQANNIGCYAWEGKADLTWSEDGRIETMNVSNVRLEFLRDLPDDEDTPMQRTFTVVRGNYRWSISGSTNGCTWSAPVVDEFLTVNGGLNLFSTFPYANTPAKGARGALSILFEDWLALRLIVKRNGTGCPTALESWTAGIFTLILEPQESNARVSSNGRTFTIDASTIGTDVKGTWTFTASRQ